MEENNFILEISNISKYFPGVQALDNVSFKVEKGEIHCLVGENGAGKSTLIKILAGAIERDSGEIVFDGNTVEIPSVHAALNLGMAIIFQELNVVDQLSVYENIFLGKEKTGFGFINRRREIETAYSHLKKLGVDFNPLEKVSSMSSAKKKMVEIVRAIAYKSKLIIMDEPSATMTEKDVQKMFEIIRSLRDSGISIIYISHRLEEIFEIGDNVTVLRDGRLIGSSRIADINKEKLIKMIVGRTLSNKYPVEKRKIGDVCLEVKDLSTKDFLKDINLVVRKGEIIGIFGLVGSGRTELARAIFGVDPLESGTVMVDGKNIEIYKPADAIKTKLGLIPEERRDQGLVTILTVRENITLASLRNINWQGFINRKKERLIADRYIKELDIRTPGMDQIAANLSGGNQQKVVISKWLSTDSNILLMDEPTRGIDVGTKSEIYKIISDLAAEGTAIIVFSSEIEEIIGISDRIFVMHNGRLFEYLNRGSKTPEEIINYAIGGNS